VINFRCNHRFLWGLKETYHTFIPYLFNFGAKVRISEHKTKELFFFLSNESTFDEVKGTRNTISLSQSHAK